MALTEKDVRKRILENIWDICPDAKKIYRNVLTGDRSQWAGLFRHQVDLGAGAITVTHGWIVRRVGLSQPVKGGFEQYTFDLLGFYGYELGTEADNSEDRWQTICDAVAKRFADKDIENPIWEFEDDDEVMTDRIGFPTIGLIRPGEDEYLHFGGGKLVVNITRC